LKKSIEIPVQTRVAEVGAVSGGSRTVPITWTTGAGVRRVDLMTGEPWIEELSCDPSAVRMGRMQSGAPLLDTHNKYSVSGILGVVENARVSGGRGTAEIRFSRRTEVEPVFQDVKDKIIRNVSVGYSVYRYKDVSTEADIKARVTRMRAMDWEPCEVSLVPVGGDAGAGTRAEAPKHVCEIEFSERSGPHASAKRISPDATKHGKDLSVCRHLQVLAELE
jgi:hypothetical protein